MAQKVYQRPRTLLNVPTHYCPGCGHGTAHKFVAEAIDHFGIRDRTVGVAPAGCSVLMYKYLDVDTIESAHGRALAVATGLKRANPDLIVFTYQGDGDLASIGLCESVHAANRGEKVAVIYINNAVYGMTGGQMAPTTLLGQKTTTTPAGRSMENEGAPLKVAEMMAPLEGVTYCERVALFDPKHVRRARKAIFRAFEIQVEGGGFALVEVLSACVTNLRMKPKDAQNWVRDEMAKVFPLGVMKDARMKEAPPAASAQEVSHAV